MIPDRRFEHIRDELREHLLHVVARNRDSMSYFKRRWEESCSVFYFEVAPDGTATRQMEIYDQGTVLQYHADHLEDADGFLTDQPIYLSEFSEFAISREEFEAAWTSHPPTHST